MTPRGQLDHCLTGDHTAAQLDGTPARVAAALKRARRRAAA